MVFVADAHFNKSSNFCALCLTLLNTTSPVLHASL